MENQEDFSAGFDAAANEDVNVQTADSATVETDNSAPETQPENAQSADDPAQTGAAAPGEETDPVEPGTSQEAQPENGKAEKEPLNDYSFLFDKDPNAADPAQNAAQSAAEPENAQSGADPAQNSGAAPEDDFLEQDPEFKKYAEEWPEEAKNMRVLAGILSRHFQGKMEEIRKSVTKGIDLDGFRRQQEEARQSKFEADLQKAHPDYVEIRDKDPEFAEWVKHSPPFIQNLLKQDVTAETGIWLLDQFKLSRSGRVGSSRVPKASAYRGAGGVSTRSRNSEDDFSSGFNEGLD